MIYKDGDVLKIIYLDLAIMSLSFGSVLSFHRIPLLKNINS